ncbi:MAG: hypothetical protein J6R42_05540 [Clostridia bacterium]|nr:hypothetical protein [Clostridia bacterium]
MIKKAITLLMLLSVCLSFVSCGRPYDESLHYQIQYVGNENGDPCHLIYQGETYLYAGPLSTFHVDDDKQNDVILSWNGHRYWGYVDVYWSDTEQNPVFIYRTRAGGPVYFHEDYDYKKDTFVIGDSGAEMVLEDICDAKAYTIKAEQTTQVTISSKQYPRIKLHLCLTYAENQWYLSFEPNLLSPWFEVSDAFVQLLSQNGII